MRVATLLLALLATAPVFAAEPTPFVAVYDVLRDGDRIGETTSTLARDADNRWTLTSETRGTAGLARLLGLDVSEKSMFDWRDGAPAALTYDYRQDATLKHKRRSIAFDRERAEAQVDDNGDTYSYAIPPEAMDRHCITLALAAALARGERDPLLSVAVKDRIERQQFHVADEEDIVVPAGSYRASRVERVDSPGKIRSWYSADRPGVPVRIEQKQGDGALIVLELSHLDMGGAGAAVNHEAAADD
jgi:hypothetical protein